MSFASETKAELIRHIPRTRHDRMAMAAAMLMMEGEVQISGDQVRLTFLLENETIRSLFFTIIAKLGNMNTGAKVMTGEEILDLLTSLKMYDGQRIRMERVDPLLLQRECCKKSFLAAAFLCAGSVSDPNKAYHLEIVCRSQDRARQLAQSMLSLNLDAKIIARKGHWVVYLKEGEQIVTMLGYMGAPLAYMTYENARIVKEMRNGINRQVNCETANIGKTVHAAVRQTADIALIRDRMGLEHLPRNLQEIALVRLEHPDMTLKDLGALLDPPVGKSGVNHRLRRISEIAEDLR